jgi:hypothetical protein
MPRRNRNTRRKQQGRRSNLPPQRERDTIEKVLNRRIGRRIAGKATGRAFRKLFG